MHDPDKLLDGMKVLHCLFCSSYKTPIEFDMATHLQQTHISDLVDTFPSKGSNINYRIKCVIEKMRKKVAAEYYDSRVAKFSQNLPRTQKPKVKQMRKDELLKEWFSSDTNP